MPEGPEVKIISSQLHKILKNQVLKNIIINGGRYSKKAPDNFINFKETLDTKIKSVNCKGKFIWFEFDNGWYLWNTLGMTGGWKVNKSKHCHITFVYGTELNEIYFDDMRNFGTLKFSNNKKDLEKKLNSLGVDIFSKEFTEEKFRDIIKNKKYHYKKSKSENKEPRNLPWLLMNQSVFSGIGNYLKSEILYESKISPFRNIIDLSDEDIKVLYKNTLKISQEAFKSGGTSVRDYSDLENKKGEYTFVLKVYAQKKDPLGNSVKKVEQDKRTTHWVPEVQI